MYVQPIIYAAILAVGFYVGDRMATGSYETQLRSLADSHVQSQDAAIKRASEASKAQSERAVREAEERGRKSVSSQEIINEIHILPDTRDCEWTDNQRMRIERLYSVYGANPRGSPTSLPNTMSDTTTD